MELSPDEIALVEQHRAGQPQRRRADVSTLAILKAALDYERWQQNNGRNDTFSEFVSEFGYEQSGSRLMYEAVKSMREHAYNVAQGLFLQFDLPNSELPFSTDRWRTTSMSTTIDWVAEDEENTPRGEVTWLKIGPESIALRFRGVEAGHGYTWAGAIILECTVDEQTISGHYEEIPDSKMGTAIKIVPYIVTGRFSDDTYKSFTGEWRGGVDTPSAYELNIDLD